MVAFGIFDSTVLIKLTLSKEGVEWGKIFRAAPLYLKLLFQGLNMKGGETK